ncbi:hypothetical protein R3I94_014549 [Phoxinus phoxinus]
MPKTKRQTTAVTTAMELTPDIGANVIVDMDELGAVEYLLPDTPSKEPAPKKGRSSDISDEVNSAMALAIISSLKTVINDRADILDKGIEGLKTSVEFLTEEMKDIKCKAERTEKRVDDDAENRINDLENKVTELARYKRRWNLRLYGLPESQGENVRQRVLDVCTSVLPAYADKVSDLTDSVHRLGKMMNSNTAGATPKPRGVIIQFTMRHFRDALWKAAKNSAFLADNHLRFAEDLSPDDRERRQQLWPLVEKARREGHRAYFVGPKAFVNGKELSPPSKISGNDN